jgi:pimeloyl-ACP methyl ester carboxylesterase
MKSLVFAAGSAAFLALSALAGTAAALPRGASSDLVLQDIALRPGVTGDIHVRVLSNPNVRCNAETILAIHGATGAASNWEPFADAIFASPRQGTPVCRLVAVDLPGHGGSSLPRGMLFGDLTLHDYVTAILATFDRLDDFGIRPTTLMGHSQGGMVVQLVQQELVDHGRNLRSAFNVKHAVLMASVGPRALPWAFVEGGTAGAALSPFITYSPSLGAHFYIPPSFWPLLVFSTPTGALASNAPSADAIAAHGWDSPEPLAALGELLGVPPLARPDVDPGIFAGEFGTSLDVVAFANDAIIHPDESEMLHTYLTGEDASSGFTVVPGADAVHGALVSEPDALLAAFAGRVSLP